ncbi:MAG: GGDEF domain-containing protein [Actinomycetota bacterium]
MNGEKAPEVNDETSPWFNDERLDEESPFSVPTSLSSAASLQHLVRLASAIVGSASDPRGLLEVVAETSCALLGAASVSISRVESITTGYDPGELPLSLEPPTEPGHARLRTIVTVGELAPGEVAWPVNETYSVADFPKTLGYLHGSSHSRAATWINDPDAELAEVRLLRSLGKASSLGVPLRVANMVWGELWLARRADQPPFTEDDATLALIVTELIAAGITQARSWQQVTALAWRDPLTDLANRRSFDEALLAELASGGLVAVVLADVNGLKKVNDQYGHQVGDLALRDVAAAAKEALGSLTHGIAARLGGDEFALLVRAASPARVDDLAQRWCQLVRESPRPVTLACGWSIGQGPSCNARDLVWAADAAAYRAKRIGSDTPRRGMIPAPS